MTTVAAFEAKTRFGELLDRVVAGEEIVITRHEKPVARIVPEGRPRLSRLRIIVDDQTISRAFSAISELAAKYSLSLYDAAYLELANRRALPLASRDEPLRTAARKCGVRLL